MIKLNAEQKNAVETDGNIVVTACPGSGKTRVLTARVVRALGEVFREIQNFVDVRLHEIRIDAA